MKLVGRRPGCTENIRGRRRIYDHADERTGMTTRCRRRGRGGRALCWDAGVLEGFYFDSPYRCFDFESWGLYQYFLPTLVLSSQLPVLSVTQH